MSNADVQWIGEFSTKDRDAIDQLRAKLASSIEDSDPGSYAATCTDDVLLLHPEKDIVVPPDRC